MPPYLALLSTLIGSNYPCLKQIFMVPKVFEPLKCDCIYFVTSHPFPRHPDPHSLLLLEVVVIVVFIIITIIITISIMAFSDATELVLNFFFKLKCRIEQGYINTKSFQTGECK